MEYGQMISILPCVYFAAALCWQSNVRPSEFDPLTFLGHEYADKESPLIGFEASEDRTAVLNHSDHGAGFKLRATSNTNRLFPRAKDDRYVVVYYDLRSEERIRCLDGVYRVTRPSIPKLEGDATLSKMATKGTYVVPIESSDTCTLHGIGLTVAKGKNLGDIEVTLSWTESSIADKLRPLGGEEVFKAIQTVREGSTLQVGGYSRIVRKINFGDKKTGLRGYVEIDQVPLTREQIADYEKKRKAESAAEKPAPVEPKKEGAAKPDDSKDRLVFSVEKEFGGVKRWQYAKGDHLRYYATWNGKRPQISMQMVDKFSDELDGFLGLVETKAESRMRLADGVFLLMPGEPVTFVKDEELSKKVKPNTIYFHFAPDILQWSFLDARIQVHRQHNHPDTAFVRCTHPKQPEDKFVQMVKEGDELLIAAKKFKVVTVVMPDEASSLIGWIELDMKPIRSEDAYEIE